MKRILTIAGSDSSGGAGIQADLKTITVLGGYGLSVVTALTAQNTTGVKGVIETPLDFVRMQMDCVLSDIGVDGAKTGMLASAAIVEVVADRLAEYKVEGLVVDPVMTASTGDSLLDPPAVRVLIDKLLPLARVVTPNIPEAEILAGINIANEDDLCRAARIIHGFGPALVLIKGGHRKDRAVDTLFDGTDFQTFDAPFISSKNTHGTGCTLSAALAAFLAQGLTPAEGVARAKTFVQQAIQGGLDLGSGAGPVNPAMHIQTLMEKDQVREDLRQALDRLLTQPLGRLVPEIRSNFGYALTGASGHQDVAAVPGRISQIGHRLVAFSEPMFGASRHVAKVIMAASRHDARTRSAMNIRYNPEILAACREAGLTESRFDRAEEPKSIKEQEGSTLEWGTSKALEGKEYTPDIIYDLGENGKEPVIRVLGQTPMEVVEKVIKIGRLV